MAEWLFVTIKVCRATRSIFALTLLSFTPVLAIALTYLAVEYYFMKFELWGGIICETFVASMPIQSWIFAMQYFKSYLYTCVSGGSVVYTITAIVKYTVIVIYAAVMISFRVLQKNAHEKLYEKMSECNYEYSCY